MSTGRWPLPRAARPLTDAERAVLVAFHTLATTRPYPPSIRDVAKARGVTVNAARERIEGLVEKGYLDKFPKRIRSIWLTQKGRDECQANQT